MGENNMCSDQVVQKLIEMGFDKSNVIEAVKAVGASVDGAIEYITNGCHRNGKNASTSSQYSSKTEETLSKRATSLSQSTGQMRQSKIWDHFQSASKPTRSKVNDIPDEFVSRTQEFPCHMEEIKGQFPSTNTQLEAMPEPLQVSCTEEQDIGPNWEMKANRLLKKHFGYSSLKSFQKEALAAWISHQDCLVLAATGSGKSLCFQIPALLTGKVVVVVSPLISLMHDQCLILSKHGVSSCFLGSGQPDSSVEQKAMRGMYSIIYVCPETILRLIKPLQSLAESRGITLFAIDEVHCISKWGHDFRPDYGRLSILRKNFSAKNLKFLKFDIPIMALTATATIQVRLDILDSLYMSKETKIVLTSFFRPNLRFWVKHSKTSESSYQIDFSQLIDFYTSKGKTGKEKHFLISQECPGKSDSDHSSANNLNDIEDSDIDKSDDDDDDTTKKNCSTSREKQMSVDYLENEVDAFQSVEDWDVAYGEFYGQPDSEEWESRDSFEIIDPPSKPEERLSLLQKPLEHGPTIIYVPTRKATLSIASYLVKFGVKVAAYNASLPKSHLRWVHKEFHENSLEVVVATMAFGMGIDKKNVRRIIHYGWPQSLEAYYQEAGRAGRDGKLADCILYVNCSRVPTLLPSKRNEDQIKRVYKMLSDCFRYGMNTSCCRAKTLVQYFGENFNNEKCLLCDICVNGPPSIKDLKEEANILMQIIAARYADSSFMDGSYDDFLYSDIEPKKFVGKPNLRAFVNKIKEQSQKFIATDLLWWKGLARIMEAKGYIREGDEKIHVQIKFPKPTKRGLDFIEYEIDKPFLVYPEADMLLSMRRLRASSSNWGKGWADPPIRQHCLAKMRSNRSPRKPRNRRRKKQFSDLSTVCRRISAKISKSK